MGRDRKDPVHSESASSTASLTGRIGGIIVKERTSRGMSIVQLSGTSGVSAGLLSQLERGIGNPSIETLANIARALRVPIGMFFEGAGVSDDVVHKETRQRLVLAEQDVTYEMLVPDLQGALSMLHIELPPNFSNEQAPFMHPGEEVCLVLSGSVTMHLGDRTHLLNEGDSIRFSSATAHWYKVGADPVVVISAMTPPSF